MFKNKEKKKRSHFCGPGRPTTSIACTQTHTHARVQSVKFVAFLIFSFWHEAKRKICVWQTHWDSRSFSLWVSKRWHTHTYTHTLDLAGQLLLSSAKQNEEVKECKTLAVCCFFFRASTRQKGRTKTAAKGSYSCVDCPPAWMAEELQTVRRKKQQQQQQHVNQTCHSIAVSQSTIEEVELPFNEAEISAGLLLQKNHFKTI